MPKPSTKPKDPKRAARLEGYKKRTERLKKATKEIQARLEIQANLDRAKDAFFLDDPSS